MTWNTYVHILDAKEFSRVLDICVEQEVKANGMESVFDVDAEATKKRNEGLTGDCYRVGFYKPEVQAAITAKCDEYVAIMDRLIEDMSNEAKSIVAEEKAYRESWEEVEVHKHVSPKGGEMGTDGYHEATYLRKSDGEKVRVISRDIFDIGCYTILAREKTLDGADNESRSEAEKSCIEWLCRYPIFSRGVRM